jgi:hypothetical protein
MSKKTELFASNHTAQIKWLDNQIAKHNRGIFLNPLLAEEAWIKLKDKSMGIIENLNVEAFMARYLSDKGSDKLYTTLRVAETRAKKNGFRLQCNIEYSANLTLENLSVKTGMSKGELISKLIEQSGQTLLHCDTSKEVQEEN